ncbi:MAG: hypothetical protein HY527_03890 [Betaproteobacteria bacterium]|nr:hypothetical protein [Betaproteobacteria bacterium]
MSENAGNSEGGKAARGLAGIALLAAALSSGCAQLGEFARGVDHERAALLAEIRAFERELGFRKTDNFRAFSREREAYSFCGYASRLHLPYSYEDPAIRWLDSVTEEDCRKLGRDADVHFGAVEAQGERGTAVTTSMAAGTLDRFLYLVIHEDCHDQFDFPYGIEEALCNLIAYKAMVAFGERKFGASAGENRAIRGYADGQSRHTRVVIGYYEQLVALYARHERVQILPEALLRERAAIFSHAERALGWGPGDMNNVVIANDMTYRRHYPFLESVYDALGRDLARAVAFFRYVDRIKPSRAALRKRHGIATEERVEFIRAYEAAVVETVRKALAESGAAEVAG